MIRCECCGQFIGHTDKKAITYTTFGSATDLDPPDPGYVCGRCWTGMNNFQKLLYYTSSWCKPTEMIKDYALKDLEIV